LQGQKERNFAIGGDSELFATIPVSAGSQPAAAREPATYRTQLREGNWDWVTQSQRWHGIGGARPGPAPPREISDSLYLTAKPAFFGSNPWPWVNASNGAVTTLPPKACLEQGKMPACMM
jgi:hypothetical protein